MDHPAATTKDEEPTLPPSLRDPKKLFFQSNRLRRTIIFAYWALILLALPIWWYTTSIERLALPTRRVHQVEENRLELPIIICVDADQPFIDDAGKQLANRILQDSDRWKGVVVEVKDNVSCSTHDSPLFMGPIFNIPTEDGNVYTVRPTVGPITIQNRQLFLPLAEPDSATKLVDSMTSLLAPYSAASDPEHRVAQYSPHYRLAFSLLNEDAAAGDPYLDWQIEAGLKAHIYPIIRRLKTLHNFTIESQVQFHAPLAFSPVQIDDSYAITSEDLTVFVNSAEWTLSSSSSNDPVLHFILFIPSAARRPLRLLAHDGENDVLLKVLSKPNTTAGTPSISSAFLLPQWGGIVIHNPAPGTLAATELPSRDLNEAFSLFANQLLALLGVAVLPAGVVDMTEAVGLSDWQLDALVRRRTFENVQGSRDTLLSIVKLVDQIENMPVGEDVRGDVDDALEALNKVYELSRQSLYQAFTHSAKSFSLSSRAFFNPGMLALLYFPAEHKYAVYSPLFASAIILLVIAALREIIAYRRERTLARDSVAKPQLIMTGKI
ncbi:phosphatidylinositol-glycan biosynthesis class S protein-domain-containing protein [Gymnopilus junonius]|uniref:Phosphatidylinositol-glycan biosynthesis class S protein-domain-containing protein n=1 Tax=Gymnopilus junonius TaxID=109634 RepID=A0A9P5NE39_GYMJU|nr:phosphatidylinositol-glycan biosynthesis class S protein-domain-containing protein [Gymnopilus junonius]